MAKFKKNQIVCLKKFPYIQKRIVSVMEEEIFNFSPFLFERNFKYKYLLNDDKVYVENEIIEYSPTAENIFNILNNRIDKLNGIFGSYKQSSEDKINNLKKEISDLKSQLEAKKTKKK